MNKLKLPWVKLKLPWTNWNCCEENWIVVTLLGHCKFAMRETSSKRRLLLPLESAVESLARELYPLLSLANQCCWSTRQSREPSTELWTFWSAFSTHFPSPEYFSKKNIKETDPKIKKYVRLKHWETMIGSCVITRYRTKQEKLRPF